MKRIGLVMTFVLLFSLLASPGCAAIERLTSLGQAAPVPILSLTPATATNVVGSRHELVAKVTSDGDPVQGVQVCFEITKPSANYPINLAPDQSVEIEVFEWAPPGALISDHWKKEKVYTATNSYVYCGTGIGGEAKCAIFGVNPGVDIYRFSATVGGHDLTATATVTWQQPVMVPVISLTPSTATDVVGSRHELVAKLTRDGTPLPGVQVCVELTTLSANHPQNLAPDQYLEIEFLEQPPPGVLISEHWKKEKVYTTSNNYVYCGTGPGGDAGYAITVPNPGVDEFRVSATVDGYDLTATATVTWQLPAAPVVISFTASPESVSSGTSSVLSWNVSGAATVTISGIGGVSPTSGQQGVAPSGTTTYKLIATNAAGSVDAQVTILVKQPLLGSACYIDFFNKQHNCQPGGAVHPYAPQGGIDLATSKAVVEIDMADYQVLEMKIEVVIPAVPTNGYWLVNIGNSPSNDGGGGDAGNFSNDSELDIVDCKLSVYGNDYSIGVAGITRPMISLDEFMVCQSQLTLTAQIVRVQIADGKLTIGNAPTRMGVSSIPAVGAYLFRLGPGPDNEAGTNDRKYYAAFNRSVGNPARSGTGVNKVTFLLKNTWDSNWQIP